MLNIVRRWTIMIEQSNLINKSVLQHTQVRLGYCLKAGKNYSGKIIIATIINNKLLKNSIKP
jgi:hypothetical protein